MTDLAADRTAPMDETIQGIPVIDVGPFLAGEPGALDATADLVRRVSETIGFYTIVNHGVPAGMIEDAFAEAARFHGQPLDAKLRVKVDGVTCSYVPLRGTTSRASVLVETRKPNENECLFIRRPRERTADLDAGLEEWPDLPGFRERTLAYFRAVEALGQSLLPLYARALGLAADHFGPLFDWPVSALRLNHYPHTDYVEDQYGIAPHTDSTFITLLAQNRVPGLQIRTPDGRWIEADPVPDSFLVNTGDLLHRWSNGRFISTPHRAMNAAPGSRYSIPYFMHPNAETVVACLPTCIGPGETPRFPPIQAGEYLIWYRSQNYDHLRVAKT